MPLTPGTRLGPYEILGTLGVGGMGEVFRARDTSLGRDVAVKVLPDAVAHDADRLARFEREARTLAALNHPNIATVYGFEISGGTRALVMELVEGPTLADRIARAALPVEESLAIARQIADALETAHEQGIVHRDLKPGNVKVREDGTVKVLDFGLAKMVEGAGSGSDVTNSPTITTPAMTQAGMILGTAAYMSPEQARGRPADKRSDIWAFGCVLYEMLAGRRAFAGEDVSETLANVLKTTPEWTRIPVRARALLQACLERDPKRRLRDIGDAWRLLAEREAVTAAARKTPWVVAAVASLAVGVAVWAPWRPAPVTPDIARLQLALPEGVTLSAASPFSISPDGRKLVFLGIGADNVSRFWLRDLDSLDARPLPGTETGPTTPSPFWSRDGRFVAFTSGGKLKKVDVNDGAVQIICDLPGVAPGGSWNRDGVIVLSLANLGIMRVSATGGTLEPVAEVDRSRREITHNNPVFLPDGRHFLYLRTSLDPQHSGIYMGAIDAPPSEQSLVRLVGTTLSADYAPSRTSGLGHLLFRRDGSLLAQAFDDLTMSLSGEPAVVADGLSSYFSSGLFSVSSNGLLVYRAGDAARSSRLVLLDRQGNTLGEPGEAGAYSNVAISPDGTRAAVRRTDYGAADQNLWLLDLSTSTNRRLTRERNSANNPVWSPDGNAVSYTLTGGGLYRMSVNGATPEETLLDTQLDTSPLSWSRDGQFLLFTSRDAKANDDLFVLPLKGERKPIPFATSEWNESEGTFSPDGRWIAYVSDDSERREVYVRAFSPDAGGGSAGVGDITTVSRGGGTRPRWRADGRELFFLGPNGNLMSVDVTPGPTFRAGPPKVLFRLPQGTAISDTGADGRTLAVVPLESGTQAPFNVVLNWESGLRAR